MNTTSTPSLSRTLADKLVAGLVGPIPIIIFALDFSNYGLIGKAFWIAAASAVTINALFILSTPAARIRNSALILYSEVQPVIFTIQPQIINLDELTGLSIDRGMFEYRMVFSLRHGRKIHHSFSVARENRVRRLLAFLHAHAPPGVISTIEQEDEPETRP